MLKARDIRSEDQRELKGKPEAEQVRILERYVRGWPPNLRGEYVEMQAPPGAPPGEDEDHQPRQSGDRRSPGRSLHRRH